MKSSSAGTSSKKKRAALNVKKALKKKTTKKESRKSSAKATAKALTRAKRKSSASRASEPSSSGPRENIVADKLFWIIISNVEHRVAYEDIVRAIFQRCVKLRSKGNPSVLGGHFEDSIEVAFETKKDAVEAVNRYQNKIRLFRKMWRIHRHKPTDADSFSGLRISDIQEAPESPDDSLKQEIQDAAVGTGDSAKVNITNIDERVPIGVVVPLFKIAGRVRSHDVFNNADGVFQGSVELMYEQSEDAAAAVRLFDDNISFFGKTWFVKRINDDNDSTDDDDDDDSDSNDGGDDDDSDSNDGDDDDDDDNDDGPPIVTVANRKQNRRSKRGRR